MPLQYGVRNGPTQNDVAPVNTFAEATQFGHGRHRWVDQDGTTGSWHDIPMNLPNSGHEHFDKLGKKVVEGSFVIGAKTGYNELFVYQVLGLTPKRIKVVCLNSWGGESLKPASDVIVLHETQVHS